MSIHMQESKDDSEERGVHPPREAEWNAEVCKHLNPLFIIIWENFAEIFQIIWIISLRNFLLALWFSARCLLLLLFYPHFIHWRSYCSHNKEIYLFGPGGNILSIYSSLVDSNHITFPRTGFIRFLGRKLKRYAELHLSFVIRERTITGAYRPCMQGALSAYFQGLMCTFWMIFNWYLKWHLFSLFK